MRSTRAGGAYRCFALLTLLSILPAFHVAISSSLDDDVAGPVVIVQPTGVLLEQQLAREVSDGLGTEQDADKPKKHTIAETLDAALVKEFHADQEREAANLGKAYNQTAQKKEAQVETVVKISHKNDMKKRKAEGELEHSLPDPEKRGYTMPEDFETTANSDTEAKASFAQSVEADVDRIIDSQDNEYVLSSPKESNTLVIDPMLIQDVVIMLAASAGAGVVFEIVKQPVINGYLLAGSAVGPGGLKLIKGLVQIETIAQLGVYLLLFGLGLELSFAKLHAVRGVAMFGGIAEILLITNIFAVGALLIGGSVTQGIFVGALASMSSTSVVVKCLSDLKASSSIYGQITIGTLILQDCSVGVMFALMPILASLSSPDFKGDSEERGEIVLLIIKVLLKLSIMFLVAGLLARTIMPRVVRFMHAHASAELFQLLILAFCLVTAAISGHVGLSHELGAFVAGVMLSTCEEHEFILHSSEGVRNVFIGLFISSIGLIMSPVFLWEHLKLLAAGTAILIVAKTALIALVVWCFQYPPSVALAVGVCMAQIGEFAFVLLSLASQLDLLQVEVYLLLLGVTALSLLSTPLVVGFTGQYLTSATPELPLKASSAAPLSPHVALSLRSDREDALLGLEQSSPVRRGAVVGPFFAAASRLVEEPAAMDHGDDGATVLAPLPTSGRGEASGPRQRTASAGATRHLKQ